MAEKPIRDAKSEFLLYNIWLAGKQCEMQKFKQAMLVGNSESRQVLSFVIAHMPFPSSARFYLYKSKEPKPRQLLFQSVVRWQCS